MIWMPRMMPRMMPTTMGRMTRERSSNDARWNARRETREDVEIEVEVEVEVEVEEGRATARRAPGRRRRDDRDARRPRRGTTTTRMVSTRMVSRTTRERRRVGFVSRDRRRDAHRTVRVRGVATIRAPKVSAAVVEGELSHARAEGDDVSRVTSSFVRIVENRSTQGRSRVVLASGEGSIERVLARVGAERGQRARADEACDYREARAARGISPFSSRTVRFA